jgi:hypothetical protein
VDPDSGEWAEKAHAAHGCLQGASPQSQEQAGTPLPRALALVGEK